MFYKGAARRLDDIDLPRIGHRIGVGEDELHAVLDVEASNSGFFPDGRLKMLPERHVFWRELGPGARRDEAARQALAYPKWGERPYPVSADARYALFARMAAIDERAAIRSCSWGLPQMMGFNASLCGYDTGRAMVEDFAQDEEHQLDAMVTFIVAAGLDDELRRHDWRGFARGYNGPGYATHGYHTRLADRFRWWQGKPDTPWSPGMCGVASVQVEDLNQVLVA